MKRVSLFLVVAALILVSDRAFAQQVLGPLSKAWVYVTPEFGRSIPRLHTDSDLPSGNIVQSYGLKIETSAHGFLQPWGSASYVRGPVGCHESVGCSSGALTAFVGLNAVPGTLTPKAPVRPYINAGVGAVYSSNGHTAAFSPELGTGLLIRINDFIAARAEMRAERYAGDTYAMLAFGTRLMIRHPSGGEDPVAIRKR